MLSINIFYSGYNILFGVLSLFLGLGSVFLLKSSKEFSGLLLVQIGGIIAVLLAGLITNMHVLFKFGLDYHFASFIIILLSLLSSILWINAGSFLYNQRRCNLEAMVLFISIALTISIYCCFIDYNRLVCSSFSSILTLIGVSYLLLISTLRFIKTFSIGFGLLFVSIFMLWGKLIVSTYFFQYNWLNLNILNWLWIYVFTGAIVFIKLENMQQDLQKSWNQIDKLNLQINNMVDSSPFPILISRITDNKILMLNEKAGIIFGISKKESGYFNLKDFLVDEKNRNALLKLLEKNHEIQDYDLMVCNLVNSTPFWLSVSAKTIEYNNEMAIYMAFQDITTRKDRENKLRTQADLDPLTLSWNRRYFEKIVPTRIKESIKKSQYFSLLMIDADKFKNVNDTYGHKSGDKVLIELAECCRNSLRENDIVCRYGGEEFVIYLENTNTASAQIVAERLRKNLAETKVASDDEKIIHFTVSIGVVSSEKNDSLEVLLRQVDDAMYLAKHKGRNRVEIYNEEEVKSVLGKKHAKTQTKRNLHPVFQNEDAEEISLLDNYENKTF